MTSFGIIRGRGGGRGGSGSAGFSSGMGAQDTTDQQQIPINQNGMQSDDGWGTPSFQQGGNAQDNTNAPIGGFQLGRGGATLHVTDQQPQQGQVGTGIGGRGRDGGGGGFQRGRGGATIQVDQQLQQVDTGIAGRGRGGGGGIQRGRGGYTPMGEQPQLVDTGIEGSGGRGGGMQRGRGGTSQGEQRQQVDTAMGGPGRGGGGGGFQRGRGGSGTGANAVPISTTNFTANADEFRQIGGVLAGSNEERADVQIEQKPPSRYVPPSRSVDDLYKEDVDHMSLYMDIASEDEDVSVSGPGVTMFGQIMIEDWAQLKLDPKLYENIVDKSKYVRPRKIQAHVIPYILQGGDVKCLSETGSGKTAAFIVPIIQKILSMGEQEPTQPQQQKPSPIAIVVEPTRELCLQVTEQGIKLANETFVKVCKNYGETSMGAILSEMRKGCHILIATPGRLKHFIEANFIDLSKLVFFVLDEADRMLENNFLDIVREIIALPAFPQKDKRQTLLYSATFPLEVQELAHEIIRDNYVMASHNKPIAPNVRVQQSFIEVEQGAKTDLLKELLEKESQKAQQLDPANPKIRRTLVFVQTRRDANKLALYLCESGLKALSINGDRSQEERESALRQFRLNEIDVLVATDVMARGIDVKDLDHVVNYDLPNDLPTYVHRIGRTGRLKIGYATSFLDKTKDGSIMSTLVDMLRKSGKEVPPFMTGDGTDLGGSTGKEPLMTGDKDEFGGW